jgi:hypothetical protein
VERRQSDMDLTEVFRQQGVRDVKGAALLANSSLYSSIIVITLFYIFYNSVLLFLTINYLLKVLNNIN